MIHYNVRWVESGEWKTHDGFESEEPVAVNDVLLIIYIALGDSATGGRVLALRVLQRVITDPVMLICAMTQHPLEEPELDP